MFLELTGTTSDGHGEWPVVVNTDHIITVKPWGSLTVLYFGTPDGEHDDQIVVRESYETIIAALTPYVLTVRRAEVAAIGSTREEG